MPDICSACWDNINRVAFVMVPDRASLHVMDSHLHYLPCKMEVQSPDSSPGLNTPNLAFLMLPSAEFTKPMQLGTQVQ